MTRLVLTSVFFLAIFQVTDASAEGSPNSTGKSKKPVAGDQLPPGTFVGRLKSLPDNSERKLVLEVEYTYLVPKNNGNNNRANNSINHKLQQIAKLQREIGRSKNPAAKLAQLERLVSQVQVEAARGQANQFRLVSERKEIEFRAAEDWAVRFLKPPPKYDEKGQPQKHTPAELQELKGTDPNAIGYEARESDLAAGQVVRVTLRKVKDHHLAAKNAKNPTNAKVEPDDKDKSRDKAAGKDNLTEKEQKARPEVTRIVIVTNAPDKGPGSTGKE